LKEVALDKLHTKR